MKKNKQTTYLTVDMDKNSDIRLGESYMIQLNDSKTVVAEFIKLTPKGLVTRVTDRLDTKCHVGDLIVAQPSQFKKEIIGQF